MQILHKRLKHFEKHQRTATFGYGSLAKAAGLRSTQASSIIRFLEKTKKTARIKTETGEALWDYFVKKDPLPGCLDEEIAFYSVDRLHFGASMLSFIGSDVKEQLKFSKLFEGTYMMFREPWLPSSKGRQSGEYIIIGELHLDLDERGLLTSYSVTHTVDEFGITNKTEFEGYGHFENGKLILLCNDGCKNLAIFNFYKLQPDPNKFEQIKNLFGNMTSLIGIGEEMRVFRVSAKKVLELDRECLGEQVINEKLLNKYGKYVNHSK